MMSERFELPVEIQAARFRLMNERPYLASALWSLCLVEKPGLETMGVDKWWRLYYDPQVVTTWSVEELSGVLYHEILHLLRDHAGRAQGYDPHLWNIAADAEINDNLFEEEVVLPGSPVTPEAIGQPNGLLAEEYYAAIGDEGETSSSPSGDGSAGEESSDTSSASGDKKASSSPMPGSGTCGSCATGHQESWEDGPPGDSSPGVNPVEGELIRRDVAARVCERHSSGQGNVPGHLSRWAEQKLCPKVNWRRELSACMRHAMTDVSGMVDYSYSRPSRRQGQIGNGNVVLPTLRQPQLSVAVVVDTSGSMDDTMLSQALAEISSILKSVGQREGVHVLAVDTHVHECRKVFQPRQIKLAGGGGTDMRVGLVAAADLRPVPQVVIVLSDGYTPWPDIKPRGIHRVIVVLPHYGGDAPEWARVVKYDPEA